MRDYPARLRLIARRQTITSDEFERTLYGAADEIDRLREIVKYYACDCDGHCDRTHDDCLINHAALGEKE